MLPLLTFDAARVNDILLDSASQISVCSSLRDVETDTQYLALQASTGRAEALQSAKIHSGDITLQQGHSASTGKTTQIVQK